MHKPIEPVQDSGFVQPDPSAQATASIAENKRKLSIAEDASTSKKPRLVANLSTEPKRFEEFISELIVRDREHATILASNFPHGTSDDQIHHFFEEVLVQRTPLMTSAVP